MPGGVPPQTARPAAPAGRPVSPGTRPMGSGAQKKVFGPGSNVRHPKYGRGTVLRREGDGEDAKLTVQFPGYGLKKLVQKYAGITEE